MVPSDVVSLGFVLWSESLFLWSAAAYGVGADPLKGETAQFPWTQWGLLLGLRVVLVAAFSYVLSHSITWAGLLGLTTLAQPVLRCRLPVRWLAEFECLWISGFMVCSLALIRQWQLETPWRPSFIHASQLAALCIVGSALCLVVRGGTYIVRGVLRKCGTLPSEKDHSPRQQPLPDSPRPLAETEGPQPGIKIAASVEPPAERSVDVKEYNRGRLIGNLERIVLTIVVAGGSYAALAFLVAAKGVVRSDEFENNRDFAEYFLIGSLTSVLVALCAGLALRFALLRLWPDLLSLQIQ
ncbi:MAG: hypothetical protein WB523_13910 [Candidatus Sulfotelmatobacter sp.]